MSIGYERLMRRPEVLTLCGLSRSSLYRMMSQGLFPKSVSIGARAVAWRESEVLDWVASRPRVSEKD